MNLTVWKSIQTNIDSLSFSHILGVWVFIQTKIQLLPSHFLKQQCCNHICFSYFILPSSNQSFSSDTFTHTQTQTLILLSEWNGDSISFYSSWIKTIQIYRCFVLLRDNTSIVFFFNGTLLLFIINLI